VNYVSRPEAAEEVVAHITSHGGNAFAHKANVAREDDVQAMFKKMIQELGTIDILVNNAGLQKDAPIDQMSLADWQFVLDVNLTGQFLCSREAIREFKRRGIRKEISCAAGKIICMSSVHEVIPWAGHVNYAASKGALNAFTRALAVELAPRGITVNAVAPGVIETEMSRPVREQSAAAVQSRILLRRIGRPEEVAYAVWFLSSRYADYITGQVLHVDGGFKME